MNINEYQLKIDTTEVSDEVLELWYGKAGTTLIKLIKDCEIIFDLETDPKTLYYFKDKICLMEYTLNSNCFWVSNSFIWKPIECIYNFDHEKTKELITHILKQYFELEIYDVFIISGWYS